MLTGNRLVSFITSFATCVGTVVTAALSIVLAAPLAQGNEIGFVHRRGQTRIEEGNGFERTPRPHLECIFQARHAGELHRRDANPGLRGTGDELRSRAGLAGAHGGSHDGDDGAVGVERCPRSDRTFRETVRPTVLSQTIDHFQGDFLFRVVT